MQACLAAGFSTIVFVKHPIHRGHQHKWQILSTTYLGLTLRNPFIAGASGYTANVDRIRELEQAGAGALVTASLFEEQIQYESYRLEEDLSRFDNLSQEVVDVFPQLKHAGAKEHLMWVRRTKEAVRIPVIASLNAVNRDTWVRYAQELEGSGADALELNFYATPSDAQSGAAEIEKEQLAAVRAVVKKVKIPVSVKLSPFYTNPLHFLHAAGPGGGARLRAVQPPFPAGPGRRARGQPLQPLPQRGWRAPGRPAFHGPGLREPGRGHSAPAGGSSRRPTPPSCCWPAPPACRWSAPCTATKSPTWAPWSASWAAWMDGPGLPRPGSLPRPPERRASNTDPGFYRRAQYVKNLLRADYSD